MSLQGCVGQIRVDRVGIRLEGDEGGRDKLVGLYYGWWRKGVVSVETSYDSDYSYENIMIQVMRLDRSGFFFIDYGVVFKA